MEETSHPRSWGCLEYMFCSSPMSLGRAIRIAISCNDRYHVSILPTVQLDFLGPHLNLCGASSVSLSMTPGMSINTSPENYYDPAPPLSD